MARSAQTPVEYSISEVRDHLGEVIEDATEGPIRIVDRGKPTMVILSEKHFEDLEKRAKSPWERIEEWRKTHAERLSDEDAKIVSGSRG